MYLRWGNIQSTWRQSDPSQLCGNLSSAMFNFKRRLAGATFLKEAYTAYTPPRYSTCDCPENETFTPIFWKHERARTQYIYIYWVLFPNHEHKNSLQASLSTTKFHFWNRSISLYDFISQYLINYIQITCIFWDCACHNVETIGEKNRQLPYLSFYLNIFQ